jgi:GntR family transcriptional regulator
MTIIDRPKSIVKQVSMILRHRIAEGTYTYGKRLPSESELAQEFGVSRATVRAALGILENERLITRRQGDGTYLNERVMEISAQLHSTWDFQCMISDSGRTPSVLTLQITKRAPSASEANILEIPSHEPVIALVRVFLADLQPVIYSTNIIPASFFVYEKENIDATLPIHYLFEKHCQQKISYSISDISAVVADDSLITYLNVKPGDAILKFRDVFYNPSNQPLLFGESFYNDKVLRLRVARAWG